MQEKGFTLIELLVVIFIVLLLAAMSAGVARKVHESTSLAVSANNIRQLAAGGINYLADNNSVFWPYRQNVPANGIGVTWWFGFESASSMNKAEGEREFDPLKGPLGGYIPSGIRPDPSFSLTGNAFKPKYRSGYIGAGYNVLLGGGFMGAGARQHQLQLTDPSKVVVFFTSAQVNTFQPPASRANPMLEEFYGVDANERTIHFRHNGKAMVSFASGNAGFLPMDESTLDTRMPKSRVGRFAPAGDTTYLK